MLELVVVAFLLPVPSDVMDEEEEATDAGAVPLAANMRPAFLRCCAWA